MKSKTVVFALVLVASLLLVGCGSGTSSRTYSNTDRTFKHETEVEVVTLDVPQAAESMKLRLDFRLTEGAASWRLVDPQGTTLWEGTTDGKFEKSRSFEPLTGEWVLQVSVEEASGKYSMRWAAEGGR